MMLEKGLRHSAISAQLHEVPEALLGVDFAVDSFVQLWGDVTVVGGFSQCWAQLYLVMSMYCRSLCRDSSYLCIS